MSTNNSQSGHSPSESFIENKENQSNIDQLLSVDIVTTSQASSSSSIDFNPTNMIANIQQHNNVLTGQHARRGRQHQQESQQRREEQQRLRQEQQQQQREQQRRRRERNQRRYEQWQERVYHRQQERDQQEQEEQDHYIYTCNGVHLHLTK